MMLKIYQYLRFRFGGYGLEHIFPINIIHRKIRDRVKKDHAMVHGHKMFLDKKDSLCLSIDEDFEMQELELVKKHVNSGDVVIDVGANIGYYTLEFARIVGKEGKVYAFEPDEINFDILLKNIKENEYKNVVVEKKAVLDKPGKVDFYLCEDNHGDHRAFDSNDGRDLVVADGVKLDDYFIVKKSKVDLIKLDIQGSEYKAVKGMQKLIRAQKRLIILTEFWPRGLSLSGVEAEKYLKLLKSLEFELFEINESDENLDPVNIEEILVRITSQNEAAANLFCIKK